MSSAAVIALWQRLKVAKVPRLKSLTRSVAFNLDLRNYDVDFFWIFSA